METKDLLITSLQNEQVEEAEFDMKTKVQARRLRRQNEMQIENAWKMHSEAAKPMTLFGESRYESGLNCLMSDVLT